MWTFLVYLRLPILCLKNRKSNLDSRRGMGNLCFTFFLICIMCYTLHFYSGLFHLYASVSLYNWDFRLMKNAVIIHIFSNRCYDFIFIYTFLCCIYFWVSQKVVIVILCELVYFYYFKDWRWHIARHAH